MHLQVYLANGVALKKGVSPTKAPVGKTVRFTSNGKGLTSESSGKKVTLDLNLNKFLRNRTVFTYFLSPEGSVSLALLHLSQPFLRQHLNRKLTIYLATVKSAISFLSYPYIRKLSSHILVNIFHINNRPALQLLYLHKVINHYIPK